LPPLAINHRLRRSLDLAASVSLLEEEYVEEEEGEFVDDQAQEFADEGKFAPPLTTLILCSIGLNDSIANMHTLASINFGKKNII
jgi:hypothetical protein